MVLVLAVSTVTLPALAWLASQLVTGPVSRGGVLAAGVAPTEVASVALTGLAGGEVALAAGLLVASTVLTVLLAGPILSIAGAHSSASQLGLLATLALVVALPLVAGSVMRTLDPLSGREQPLVRILGTVSLLVLLWEVASELHLRANDARVVIALLLYLVGGAVLGVAARDRRALPASYCDRAAYRHAGLRRGRGHRYERFRGRCRRSSRHLRHPGPGLRHSRRVCGTAALRTTLGRWLCCWPACMLGVMRLEILQVPDCPRTAVLETRLAPLLAGRPDIEVNAAGSHRRG